MTVLGACKCALRPFSVNVKFRCKVIRHLMSNSVSKMPIFGVLGLIFSMGERSTNLQRCIIKLHADRKLSESMSVIRSVTMRLPFETFKRIKYSGN